MRRVYSSIALFAGLAFLAAGCVNQPRATQLLAVSFPNVKLEQHEYIERVEMSVTDGRIESVNHILDDWDTEATWDNPSLMLVNLEARHFSSGLADVHKLDGF